MTYIVTPKHGFIYACPQCGQSGFVTSVPAELDREDREEMRESGIDPTAWVTCPEFVDCQCGATLHLLYKSDEG